MKKKSKIYSIALAALFGASLSSCDSYLDEMPDNRTEIYSEDKVVSLLTSAYPQGGSYIIMNELMSDQCDDMGVNYNSYTSRFADQAFAWKDMTESDNDGTEMLWQYYYNCIAAANQALQAIDDMGGATTNTLKECKAEALLCRAYAHFILASEFCMAYDPSTAASEIGITYMTKPETKLNPTYDRGTLANVYEHIDADLTEALPLVGDSHLSVAKYHFNTQAAYAFATRFYLFYQKWDKAVSCANKCLGTSPAGMLRDWDTMETWGVTNDLTPRGNAYIDAQANCNLLITTAVSLAAFFSSNYSLLTKYSHNTYLSTSECARATNLWGDYNALKCQPLRFQGKSMDRCLIAKFPAGTSAFWVVDEVAQTGYYMTTSVPLKADEVLLERAEAYIMLKQYDNACSDLTAWMQNFVNTNLTLTTDTIDKFYKAMDYYQWNAPTLKRHLQPTFSYDGEGSLQESMLHCVLNFKRIEGVHEGFRWWDIKRYGITVYHRIINADGEPGELVDTLGPDDPRRAIQLPSSVISSGMTPNSRLTTSDPASMGMPVSVSNGKDVAK